MQQKIWKIILILPTIAALILEMLPYGAVLNFAVQQESGSVETVRVLTSYFDPLNFGYANFGPMLTALLTCALFLCGGALFFSDRASMPVAVLSVFACAASLSPLLYGIDHYSGIGAAISVLLGVEIILAFVYRRFYSEKARERYL